MEEDPLQKLLNEKASAGRFDSSGTFTLPPERAHLTVGRGLEAAIPGYTVLRLVQTAVSAGAGRLEVRLGYRRVRVSFQAPAFEAMHPKAVARSLCHGQLPTSGPEAHLIPALLAASQDSVRFSYAHDGFGFECKRSAVTLQSTRGTQGYQIDIRKPDRVIKGTSLRDFPELGQQLLQVAGERWALEHRCGGSPLEIRLNGKTLENRVVPECRRSDKLAEVVPFFFHASVDYGPGLPLHLPPGKPGQRLRAGETFMRRTFGEGAEVRQALLLPLDLWGPGKVIFYHDGVLLEPAFCKLGVPGAVVYAPLSPCATDASGLKVVEDETFESRVAAWREELKELAEEVKPQVKSIKTSASMGEGLTHATMLLTSVALLPVLKVAVLPAAGLAYALGGERMKKAFGRYSMPSDNPPEYFEIMLEEILEDALGDPRKRRK